MKNTLRPNLVCTTIFVVLLGTAWAEDWPVAAHDVRRSGASAAEIRPPFKRRWYRDFSDEGIFRGVQPVVAGGKVFIGTMRGTLHAIDDVSGADAWKAAVPGGIFCSVAVALDEVGGTVYVQSGRGKLHAFDTANGRQRWMYDPGVNLAGTSSPLPFAGRIYFCGRDGAVCAVNAKGSLDWKARAGAAIVQSTAIDPQARRLYVGAEDMCAYAFSLDDGKLLWKSEPLPGITFAGYYPVVLPGGAVAFTTRPFNSESDKTLQSALIPLFGKIRNDRDPADTTEYAAVPNARFSHELNPKLEMQMREKFKQPGMWEKQFAAIREQLAANPHRQTLFLLDGASGKRGPVPAVIYAEPMLGTCAPPVVMSNGKIVVSIIAANTRSKIRGGLQKEGPPDTREPKEAAWLNPETGDVTLIHPDEAGGEGTGLDFLDMNRSGLSAAGNILLLSHENGFDSAEKEGEKWRQNWKEAPEFLEVIRGESLRRGNEFVPRGLGVYGGTGAKSPVVIAGKTLYQVLNFKTHAGACLTAYEMTDKHRPVSTEINPTTDADRTRFQNANYDFDYLLAHAKDELTTLNLSVPGTPGNPLVGPASLPAGTEAGPTIKDEDLDKIIFEASESEIERRVSPHLQIRLLKAGEELVSQDWAPLAFPEGRAFDDPLEMYYALGTAYPYFNGLLQKKAREYVSARLAKLNPLAAEVLDGSAGARREAYLVPQAILVPQASRLPVPAAVGETAVVAPASVPAGVREKGLARLYPLWLYAHATKDWKWIDENYAEIKATLNAAVRPADNAYLSGLIAYCRIAAHRDDEKALAAGREKALAVMRERIGYEVLMTRGGVYFPGASSEKHFGPGRWMHLTPEIGRLLKQFAPDAQKQLVARYVDHHRPAWFMAWGILAEGGDGCTAIPLHAAAHFHAKALLVDTPPEELDRATDIPWCKADLYFMEKIALTLRAQGDLQWVDVRKKK